MIPKSDWTLWVLTVCYTCKNISWHSIMINAWQTLLIFIFTTPVDLLLTYNWTLHRTRTAVPILCGLVPKWPLSQVLCSALELTHVPPSSHFCISYVTYVTPSTSSHQHWKSSYCLLDLSTQILHALLLPSTSCASLPKLMTSPSLTIELCVHVNEWTHNQPVDSVPCGLHVSRISLAAPYWIMYQGAHPWGRLTDPLSGVVNFMCIFLPRCGGPSSS